MLCAPGHTPNPEFYVPQSFSGKGDLPGGDAMVTLGLWDHTKFVASKFFQASTAMHELGHTLDLRHGGAPPAYHDHWRGNTTVQFEPNCKPNYLSVMNYMYQFPGLKTRR